MPERCVHVKSYILLSVSSHLRKLLIGAQENGHFACRDFADVLECVKGDKARVVAVTSGSRANEVNDTERPGFFDQITKVL